MKIAIVTAGGAGMYCGSCMHDNTLAAALLAAGHDVVLLPTYTPIRTDEPDVSHTQVFLGGINMYLHQKTALWRRMPGTVRRWLDATWVLKALAALSLKTDASQLGPMTLSVLRGAHGQQSAEVEHLARYVGDAIQPDVVVLSNALLAGVVPPLREFCHAPLLCLLQGDDVFLEALPEPFRSEALALLKRQLLNIDGFLVHSRYYREFMAEYLALAPETMHQVPLGLNQEGFRSWQCADLSDLRGETAHDAAARRQPGSADGEPSGGGGAPLTVGYFARICPEKGLHVLVEAFGILRGRVPSCRLRVGGYLGTSDRRYFRDAQGTARRDGYELEYVGVPDRAGKIRFLESLDVLSVPTVYREPKGLYVLEALASGVPVVQPAHGAFPELLEQTGAGLLVEPNDPRRLADALERLYREPATRRALAVAGLRAVREHYSTEVMADATLAVLGKYVQREASEDAVGSAALGRA
jgi:glycosyltransferase involved in cell wall biosynthesis